jgi:SAM-dependent methyltransferase
MKDLKEIVKEKYTEIAQHTKGQNQASCCGSGSSCCSNLDVSIFSENYNKIPGYFADADLGLGCGLPTEFAIIKPGDTVIDLGSGAGNDAFVARSIVGESGLVIGVDMTEAMIALANKNCDKHGFTNVQFRLGDIENMPIGANKADVVISNCVLNLVPDKKRAFAEIFRVLKANGHFSISDVVLVGELPAPIVNAAEMYAGCVSGAIQKDAYMKLIEDKGFVNIKLQKEKQIIIPDEILLDYLTEDELVDFNKSKTGIYSTTVYAEKPECGSCSECSCS